MRRVPIMLSSLQQRCCERLYLTGELIISQSSEFVDVYTIS